MDIIVLLILLLSAVLGARKGLSMTLASFMQWFVCVILGLFLCKQVKQQLIAHTPLEDTLQNAIASHIQTTIQESGPYRAIPDLFSSWVNKGVDAASYGTAASVTEVVLFVLSFLLVVFGIKLVAFLIVHLISKKYHHGLAGFFDGLMGFAFGLVRGVILVLLFFAVLVPVLSVVAPDLAEPATAAMEGSRLADLLYQNNIFLVLIRDLFS